MVDPIWRVLEHQGRSLKWLAERTGYAHQYVRKMKIGLAPISLEFRERCAAALDLPLDVLFFSSDCAATATHSAGKCTTAPQSAL